MQRVKVFGIGFHKTGTTSLGRALKELGYRVCGPVGVRDPEIAERVLERALPLVERFDAFQDNPWPVLFRAVDEQWPGSKFVLTVRPPDAWIESLVRHFGGQSTPMREYIYGPGKGDPRGHERHYLDVYNTHNRAVIDYFRDRDDDLLVHRITEGEGWEKLCPFLGHPIPATAFPVANTVNDRHRNDMRRAAIRYWKKLMFPLAAAGVAWKRK